MNFFVLLLLIILGIIVLWLLLKGLILIRANEVGIVTRRMFGNKLPQGKIIATKGEIGVQANSLMPGLYFYIPIIWRVEREKVIEITPDHIGIVSSIEGAPIPSGRLLGDEVQSNSFQDARMFLENGGCKGPQIAILKPGTYRINTHIFSVSEKPIVAVQQGKVGIVNALDGIPLPSRFRLLRHRSDITVISRMGRYSSRAMGIEVPNLRPCNPGITTSTPCCLMLCLSL